MKFNVPQLFAGIILLAFFASCGKETSLENGTPGTVNPVPVDSGTYIDRIRYTDVTRNGLDSFTYVDQYKYDANKRLLSISSDSMFVNPGNQSFIGLYSHVINFYYNGTDTLPFKKTAVFKILSSGRKDSSTNFFFYSGNRLLKDSAIDIYTNNPPIPDFTNTELSRFSYAPGKIFIERTGLFTDTYDTLLLDANENIINSKSYDSFSGLEFETVVTYDNKPNPLHRYKPFHLYIMVGPEPNEDAMNGFNNHASMKNYDIAGGALLVDEAYTYQYNTLGLPIMRSQTGLGPLNKAVHQYYYKKL
jgi:hypothetical protein